MTKNNESVDERLKRLGERLVGQPSVVDRVMDEVDRTEPVRIPFFNQRRILTMMLKPRNLAAAAAVLAVVVFGLRPWAANSDNGTHAWWLAPPSIWAAELQTDIEEAGQQGYACQEQFINLTVNGDRWTSSTTSTFFTVGNRYRRDIYDAGRLRESQWYVQDVDELTQTSVRYNDKTYTVTPHPKTRQEDVDPMRQIEALAQLLEESGRRLGTERIEGKDAVEFAMETKKSDARPDEDEVTKHVWLDQATKMPVKITHQFPVHNSLDQIVVATIIEMDHFDWNLTLPANTFQPEIPEGFTKVENE